MVNLNKVIIPSGLKLSEDPRLIEMGDLLGIKIYSNKIGGRAFIRSQKQHENVVALYEEIKHKKDSPSTCCGKDHICYWWFIDGRNVVWHQVGSSSNEYLIKGYWVKEPRDIEIIPREYQLFHNLDELKHKSVKRQMMKKVFQMFSEFYQDIDLKKISIFRAVRNIFTIRDSLPLLFNEKKNGLNPSLAELQIISIKEFLKAKLKMTYRLFFSNVKKIERE